MWILFCDDNHMCSVCAESYSDTLFDKNIKGCKTSMPSKGDVKVLVLAVEFADMKFEDGVDETLEQYFFGEQGSNYKLYPQESVNAFYERSSFGKLHLSGDIAQFSMPHDRSYYEQSHEILVDELLETYTKSLIKNNQVTSENEEAFLDNYMKQYDANNDGVIDGVYIYCAGDSADSTSLWKSYTKYWDEKSIGDFLLGSCCLFGELHRGRMIQLTGQMLGLEDYFSSSFENGIFSIDMMSGYMGDINVFHKMLMGWIKTDNITIIKEGENTYSLEECTKEGECVVIAPDYDTKGLYSEFYLIAYRDFERNDTIYNFDKVKGGLCVYYVNATLNEQETDFLCNIDGVRIPLIKQVHADNEVCHYSSSCDRWQSHARIPCPEGNMGFILGNMEDDCFFHEGDAFTPYTLPASVFYGKNINDKLYSGIEIKNIVYHGDYMEFDAGFEEEKKEPVITYTVKSKSGKADAHRKFGVELLFSTEVQFTDSDSSIKYNAATLMNEIGEKVDDLSIDISNSQRGVVYMRKSDSELYLEENQIYSVIIPEGTFTDSIGNTVGEIIIEYSTIVSNAPVKVEGIKLEREILELMVGEDTSLGFTIKPTDATNTSVAWQSSDENVAIVDDAGNVTATGPGETMITVTTEDGGFQSSCRVTVTETRVPVTGVSLDRDNLVMEIGQEYQFRKTIQLWGATNQKVTWESSNASVVTVDEQGKAMALKEGNAVITVITDDGGFCAMCRVKVVTEFPPVYLQGISLNLSHVEMYIGETHAIYAITNPTDADNQNVSWSSSDERIVKVSQKGVLEAYNPGSAIITVTSEEGNYTAQCNVTVHPVLIRHIDVQPVKPVMQVSEKTQVLVNFAPSNATMQKFKWSSSDNQVAMVNDQGIVTGIAEGKVTIIATAMDGGGASASCEITIEEGESQSPSEEKFPDVGTKIRLSTGTYQVTKASNKAREVTFVKPKNSKKITLSIPPTITIDGYCYKVTAIANKACKGNKKLKSVKIGGNVKKIGKEAFLNCKRLRRIAVKSTALKSIGKNSIKGIYKKAIITVPKERYPTYKKLLTSKTGYKKTMKIKK